MRLDAMYRSGGRPQTVRPDSAWAHKGTRPSEDKGYIAGKPPTPSKAQMLNPKDTLSFISTPSDRISEWQNFSDADKNAFMSRPIVVEDGLAGNWVV